jgi:hypothetical protein
MAAMRVEIKQKTAVKRDNVYEIERLPVRSRWELLKIHFAHAATAAAASL